MRRFMIVLAVLALAMLALAPSVLSKGTAANNFVAQLSGANEVPPVATSAHGTAQFHVSKDGSTVSFKVVVNQPSSPVVAAHIHKAPAGSNGGVVVDLFGNASKVTVNNNTTVFSGSLAVADFPLFSFADTLAGLHYVNVHTTNNPGGEIRGQMS